MNWGYKIIVVYAIFIAGILFMVFKSSSQKMDLVTTDYYAKELKYQQKIDEAKHTDALSEKIHSEIKGNQLLIHFPKDFNGKKIEGDVELYYPADEDKDIKQHFDIVDSPLQMIIPAGTKGLHELHITWNANRVPYYFEQKVFS